MLVIDWQLVLNEILAWLSTEGVKLVFGVIVLFIVFKIINRFTRRMVKNAEKKNRDKTLTKVLSRTLRIGLKLVAGVVFLGFVGVDTAGIGAAITSVGLAIGLALQGSLSNFAGGVIIILMRPFKLDDYIESNGYSGTVEDIQLFYTYLVTPDNKSVMIPNGILANDTIINYSAKKTRRLEWKFGISYNEDFNKAKQAIIKCITLDDRYLKEKDIFVKMSGHLDSEIEITTRIWVNSEDYWDVHFAIIEAVKKEFDAQNIEVPYPQLDVHLDK